MAVRLATDVCPGVDYLCPNGVDVQHGELKKMISILVVANTSMFAMNMTYHEAAR